MLQAADIHVRFGRAEVLHGVSVTIGHGDVVGVLGPNGSGKTTLLRVLSGGLRPGAGRVSLDGTALDRIAPRELATRIAVVPQELHPVYDYSVLDLALMGRYAHLGAFAFESPEDIRAVRRALAATGTDHLEDRPFDTLSGGEKQRVVIASALAQFDTADEGAAASVVDQAGSAGAPRADGRVLVLDEPTAALDLHYQLEVAVLLRRLNRDARLTMVVSTHDLHFAEQVCTSVVLLREGRVLAAGSTGSTLTTANVRALYGVAVDELRHPDGRRALVPAGLSEHVP